MYESGLRIPGPPNGMIPQAHALGNTGHGTIHTYIHTHTQTYIPIYLPTYLHTYIPTYLRTYIHTHIHTYIPTYLPTYLPTYIHTYVYIHICTHIYIICAYIYIHCIYASKSRLVIGCNLDMLLGPPLRQTKSRWSLFDRTIVVSPLGPLLTQHCFWP